MIVRAIKTRMVHHTLLYALFQNFIALRVSFAPCISTSESYLNLIRNGSSATDRMENFLLLSSKFKFLFHSELLVI